MDSSASVVEELVARGLVSEEAILNRLAEEFSLPRVNLLDIATPQRAIAGVERQFCLDNEMLFYDRSGSSVKAAIYNPLELEKVDHFSQVMALDIEPYLASKEAILQAIERIFPEKPRRFSPFTGKFPHPTRKGIAGIVLLQVRTETPGPSSVTWN